MTASIDPEEAALLAGYDTSASGPPPVAGAWADRRAREIAEIERVAADKRAQVLRRLRWRPDGWTLEALARDLDWPGGVVGVPIVLRQLVTLGDAECRPGGRWHAKHLGGGREEVVTRATGDSPPAAPSPPPSPTPERTVNIKDEIIEYIREHADSTSAEINSGLGIDSASAHLTLLHKAGRVVRVSIKVDSGKFAYVYSLPSTAPAGEAAAPSSGGDPPPVDLPIDGLVEMVESDVRALSDDPISDMLRLIELTELRDQLTDALELSRLVSDADIRDTVRDQRADLRRIAQELDDCKEALGSVDIESHALAVSKPPAGWAWTGTRWAHDDATARALDTIARTLELTRHSPVTTFEAAKNHAAGYAEGHGRATVDAVLDTFPPIVPAPPAAAGPDEVDVLARVWLDRSDGAPCAVAYDIDITREPIAFDDPDSAVEVVVRLRRPRARQPVRRLDLR